MGITIYNDYKLNEAAKNIWKIRDDLTEIYYEAGMGDLESRAAKFAPIQEMLANAAEAVDKLRRES